MIHHDPYSYVEPEGLDVPQIAALYTYSRGRGASVHPAQYFKDHHYFLPIHMGVLSPNKEEYGDPYSYVELESLEVPQIAALYTRNRGRGASVGPA